MKSKGEIRGELDDGYCSLVFLSLRKLFLKKNCLLKILPYIINLIRSNKVIVYFLLLCIYHWSNSLH